MPKDKSGCSQISHKARDCAYRPYSNLGNDLFNGNQPYTNDWEGATCPVCMETPHNALLLRCSSYGKGCRPYMCDTSYRHSNCFDQYVKAHSVCQETYFNGHEDGEAGSEANLGILTLSSIRLDADEERGHQPLGGLSRVSSYRGRELEGLPCPLCRGLVQGCEVPKAARDSLNRKVRVCAREACSFAGSYEQLRAHARKDHPGARPAEIDPARQRDWVQMERRHELGDVLSVIQSAMPHAIVSGDYAIDGEEDNVHNVDRSFFFEGDHLLTVILLFQVFGPLHPMTDGTLLPPFRGIVRRRRRQGSSRHGLWGEILQESQNRDVGGNYREDIENERHQRHHQRSSFG